MLTGTILGKLTLSRTYPGAEALTWVRVRTENGSEAVALDHVGAAQGDKVLLCVGDGAWRSCQCCPVDMAVVGVADGNCG